MRTPTALLLCLALALVLVQLARAQDQTSAEASEAIEERNTEADQESDPESEFETDPEAFESDEEESEESSGESEEDGESGGETEDGVEAVGGAGEGPSVEHGDEEGAAKPRRPKKKKKKTKTKGPKGKKENESRRAKKHRLNPAGCGTFQAKRIFGGSESTPESWPWQAELLLDRGDGRWHQFCGGALITERHVLTAAHCVAGKPAGRIRVRLGNTEYEDIHATRSQRRDRGVKWIRRHANYDGKFFKNDIAILRLRDPPKDSRGHNAVCLATNPKDLYTDNEGIATGHGLTNGRDKSSGSPVLLETNLMVFDNKRCREAFPTMRIDSKQLCVGSDDGPKGTCQGDSGGPFMVRDGPRYVMIGVVSYGVKGCDTDNKPFVYTRVSHFADWIKMNTKT